LGPYDFTFGATSRRRDSSSSVPSDSCSKNIAPNCA
jgi:hypothetical protein